MENKENAISRSVRIERPGNYLFKIQSFSLLLDALAKTKRDKFESPHFDAGGYKWKLLVYPNGDKKRGGDAYLSLYLALADPKFRHQGRDILLFVKFFIYDCIRDNYLVLEDGKEKRFHTLKTECGISKLLPIDTFNDPAKGYIVDDSCVFGVEILFNTIENRGEVSLFKNNTEPGECFFIWKIDKFSTLSEMQQSNVFTTIGGTEWTLVLHPKGDAWANETCLSLFLTVNEHDLPLGCSIYAEYKLTITDQLNHEHYERTIEDKWFSRAWYGWGYSEFMQLSDLKNSSRGFIVNDTIVIEVEFMCISVTNSLT